MRGRRTYDIIVYPLGPPLPNFHFNNFFFKIMTHIINLILKKKKKNLYPYFFIIAISKIEPTGFSCCMHNLEMLKKERKKERKKKSREKLKGTP